jgi:protein-tyrosine phosphatase
VTFRVLFVCHANLCRSPMAERLARRAFDDALGINDIATASAGMRAFDGEPMHPKTAEVLAECGVDAGDFASRTVDPGILRESDLVLTATVEQRTSCLALEPTAARRTFTLRQFARFAEAAGPGKRQDMRHLVETVNATRHRAPAGEDNLADPMGQPIGAFRACAEEIWGSLRVMIGAIT